MIAKDATGYNNLTLIDHSGWDENSKITFHSFKLLLNLSYSESLFTFVVPIRFNLHQIKLSSNFHLIAFIQSNSIKNEALLRQLFKSFPSFLYCFLRFPKKSSLSQLSLLKLLLSSFQNLVLFKIWFDQSDQFSFHFFPGVLVKLKWWEKFEQLTIQVNPLNPTLKPFPSLDPQPWTWKLRLKHVSIDVDP